MSSTQGTRNTGLVPWNRARACVSASELPADVLLRVFLILRDVSKYESHEVRTWHFSTINERWDWTTVSMVCTQWRLIAVEYPNLWTKIRSFTNADRICAYLERSGRAELDVDMKIRSFDRVGIPVLLEGHMWRVRAFKLAANMGVSDSMVPRLTELTQRAMTLDLAYITDMNEERQYSRVLQSLPDILPNIYLDSLSLKDSALPWSSSLYYGLSELNIQGMFMWEIYVPTVWEFIGVLEHCLNLQHLGLTRFSPRFGKARISEIEERRLRFPQLGSIALVGLNICSKIFAVFTIGADVDVELWFPIRFGDECEYEYDLDDEDEAAVEVDDLEHVRLPQNLLIERNGCKSIDIILEEMRCTIRSTRVPHSDTYSGSPETIISTPYNYDTSKKVIPIILALLEDRFWQSAEEVRIYIKSDTCIIDKVSWISLLYGLPRSTQRLSIKFEYLNYRQQDVGLPGALSERPVDGRVNLPELEQLTVCYKGFPPEFVSEGRYDLFECMEERRKYALRECRGIILDQRVNRPTPYTVVEVEQVFIPILGEN